MCDRFQQFLTPDAMFCSDLARAMQFPCRDYGGQRVQTRVTHFSRFSKIGVGWFSHYFGPAESIGAKIFKIEENLGVTNLFRKFVFRQKTDIFECPFETKCHSASQQRAVDLSRRVLENCGMFIDSRSISDPVMAN